MMVKRSDKEMFDLILKTAQEDSRIRAVLLVGSRADPSVPKDSHQDFDITYLVTEVAPFYDNQEWIIKHFGEPSLMQKPELGSLLPPEGDGHFTWLMVFPDGNRIDLTVDIKLDLGDGEPYSVLLDKYGITAGLAPMDRNYWNITPPTPKAFYDCCNEFWWCLNNVGKGIARDELPYVMHMFHVYVRDMLDKMTEWYIGFHHDFSVSAGKLGKYFKRYLPEQVYQQYRDTYSDGDYTHVWQAVDTACDLFHSLALEVAGYLKIPYCQDEEDGLRAYLQSVRD